MRHLVSISDFSNEEVKKILKMTNEFEEVLSRRIKKVPALSGKTIAFLFVEPSTRTRLSFELAAKRLSADTITLTGTTSSLKKGETLEDTAHTLSAMKVDAVVVRHSKEGAAQKLASLGVFSVINGGDGKREHPTQAILDLYTAQKEIGNLNGKKVAIVGDILHSRVARSGMQLWHRWGSEVILVAPPTLLPAFLPEYAKVSYSLDEVIDTADILYFLRIQRERLTEPCFPSVDEYREYFALTSKRLNKARKDAVIMHPGPVNEGVEFDPEVIKDKRSLVNKQVYAGVAVRMAILVDLLSEGSETFEIST